MGPHATLPAPSGVQQTSTPESGSGKQRVAPPTATAPGRNDPCSCGSSKKYKRCCLDKDEAAAALVREAERAATAAATPDYSSMLKAPGLPFDDPRDPNDLDEASNVVPDLIRAGKLDEAEKAAQHLLTAFPDVHDGYDRLGMVCEARGDKKQAADYYRKVIAFVEQHADTYDPAFADTFRGLVAKLDAAPGA